ncbi:MAG: beta-L-arabinofuranosidase domain-containing protein [Bacillota bacterium]
MHTTTPAPWHKVTLRDPVWASRMRTMREVGLRYQWEALNDRVPGVPRSHAVANFRIAAGDQDGTFYGMVFQDSDVYKWLEAAAYFLAAGRDPELEQAASVVVDLIARAQQPDGYLNTYFTIAEPGKRWTNVRERHELYCAGHMIEAAVAHFQATGDRRLLDVACRLADHIASVFGRGPGQKRGYPGHPEAELALVKLYRATGERRYLELSRYFIEERGQQPHWYDIEADARGEPPERRRFDYSYSQAHMPFRQQTKLDGHAVRALYLLSGAIDVATETADRELLEVCRRLFANATGQRMYVTGGVGSSASGERFTFDYDLPNDRAYSETCASIALVFAAHRMVQVDVDRQYTDMMERALYNSVLSGISLDGTKFFYVNPLEVWPEASLRRYDTRHVLPVRQGWFDCACCPPNLARLIASVGQYMYSTDDSGVYFHLYAAGEAQLEVGGTPVRLAQETLYPWDGAIRVTVHPRVRREFTLALRIPGWARSPLLSVNGQGVSLDGVIDRGYAYLTRTWREGDVVELQLPMPVERIEAHPQVRADAGKIAIQRGPIVYCLEEVDNGPNLPAIVLPRDSALEAHWEPDFLGGVVVVTGSGMRVDESSWEGELYRPVGHTRARPVDVTAVPYATWGNRKPGEMLVWLRES